VLDCLTGYEKTRQPRLPGDWLNEVHDIMTGHGTRSYNENHCVTF